MMCSRRKQQLRYFSIAMAAICCCYNCGPPLCSAWLPSSCTSLARRPSVFSSSYELGGRQIRSFDTAKSRVVTTRHKLTSFPDQDEEDYLDVEFERVEPKTKGRTKAKRKKRVDTEEEDDDWVTSVFGEPKNLIDLSFETADQPWDEVRIPFYQGEEYIDGKLAFMVDFEGQSYGIAVPFDDAVGVVVQEVVVDESDKKNPTSTIKTTNISPESYDTVEEYAELMEIFAKQVHEQLGEDLYLRKTPKVLTISGGLDEITKNWQKKVVSKPLDVDELLEAASEKDAQTMEKELQEFYTFMRQELGDEEFEKTMNGQDEELSKEDEEFLNSLFTISGVGIKKDDLDGMENLVKSLENDLKVGVPDAKKFTAKMEDASLKLLGYTFPKSGKSYFLVKPLKPVTLIGRQMKEVEDSICFELLTPEEEQIIIPKIESMCEEEMKSNGLTFESTTTP